MNLALAAALCMSWAGHQAALGCLAALLIDTERQPEKWRVTSPSFRTWDGKQIRIKMKQRVRKARTAERLKVPEIAVPLNMEPMKLASPSPRNSCSRCYELVKKTKRGQGVISTWNHEEEKKKDDENILNHA